MRKLNINISPGGTICTLILYGILAYFVYDHNMNAVLGVIVITIITGMIFMLSFIPVIGWLAAIVISYYVAIPALLNLVGIEYTWLITLILVIDTFIGFIITVAMILAIMRLRDRR